MTDDFLRPRRFLRAPIPEIFEAAHLLDRAVGAHIVGDREAAHDLIALANSPTIRQWTESLWGGETDNPNHRQYHRFRDFDGAAPHLPKAERVKVRMPSARERREIVDHYGYNCAFCGIPVIRLEVRKAVQTAYPDALPWGQTNETQHAAFQCMWLQFDHVLPHSRGGDNSVENVVITCAPCNFGRRDWVIEEVGLIDPRSHPVYKTSWDGLERFLAH